MIEALEGLDFDTLEDQFGEKFAAEIKEHVEYCNKRGLDFRVEIIDETSHFIKVAFSTFAYTYLYEISKVLKKMVFENNISRFDCEEILKLMDEINKKKQ